MICIKVPLNVITVGMRVDHSVTIKVTDDLLARLIIV